ncbi:MAG: imidazole glycerol phosphate synthase subunit HisH [Christensenellaceae bacterium]|jgi:glutamine amidotransferase|nr:imidazole glycerol phosphate synthase subunit HisH [Christensenellaceae bacterium]
MIGVIDYGLGNMFSLLHALKHIGADFTIVNTATEENLDALILPGVGAFPEGMKKLINSGMIDFIVKWRKPLLGICLGMQLLFSDSEEFTHTKGLDLIEGNVVKIKGNLKIPHMGWNGLDFHIKTSLCDGISSGDNMYFVHSYKVETPKEYVVATAEYGQDITAIVKKDNVIGMQFHPEKSGECGLKLLKNFVKMSKNYNSNT